MVDHTSTPCRVLVPLTSAERGGSQLALLRLMESCPPERFEFRCWLFGSGPLMGELDRRRIAWRRFPGWWLRMGCGLGPLARHLRREEPDVIYLHASRIIAYLARRVGIPCIERINMPRRPGVGGWCRFRRLDRWATGLNMRVLPVSRALADQLAERGIPRDKLIVFRDLIYPDQFHRPETRQTMRRELGIADGEVVVLNAGRLVPQKGQIDVLRVADRLRGTTTPPLRFLLVGEGPLADALEEDIDSRSLTGQVQRLPFEGDMARLYAAADIYLQASRWEGLATVLLEARAAGLAIVATDVDGTAEALADYPRAWLAPPGDLTAMARMVREAAVSGSSPRPPFPDEFQAPAVCRHFAEIVTQVTG